MYWTDGPMIERKLLAVRKRSCSSFWRRILPRRRDVAEINELLLMRRQVQEETINMLKSLNRQAAELRGQWNYLQSCMSAVGWL